MCDSFLLHGGKAIGLVYTVLTFLHYFLGNGETENPSSREMEQSMESSSMQGKTRWIADVMPFLHPENIGYIKH